MKNLFKSLFMLSIVILLCGCSSRTLTNDEVIREVKKCEDKGLKAETYPSHCIKVESVHCHPKD